MARIRVQIGDTIYYNLSKIESTRVYELSKEAKKKFGHNYALHVSFTNGHANEPTFESKDEALAKQTEIDDAIAEYRNFVDKVKTMEVDDG